MTNLDEMMTPEYYGAFIKTDSEDIIPDETYAVVHYDLSKFVMCAMRSNLSKLRFLSCDLIKQDYSLNQLQMIINNGHLNNLEVLLLNFNGC